MNKEDYKSCRKVIMNEYDNGLLTSSELGEVLFHLTDTYRKANNVAKSGRHSESLINEDGIRCFLPRSVRTFELNELLQVMNS